MKSWGDDVNRAISHREKGTLTDQDLLDARSFMGKPDDMLTLLGEALKKEVKAQVDYMESMSLLHEEIENKPYMIHSGGAAPGMNVVFKKAADMCKTNPTFQSSLVVALLKAAVAKALSPKGSNAKTPIEVTNFIRLIGTYDKKASQVVSTNLGGPGDRWVRKLNSKERKDCILDGGEQNIKIVQRMLAAIARRE